MKRKKEAIEEERPWYRQMSGGKWLLLNIVGLFVAGALLMGAAALFLGVYTQHNGAFRLPDIKGLSREEARAQLEAHHLTMEVIDSTYVAGEAPGIVLETAPKAGTLIKRHRTIFVTVNTQQVKTIPIPKYEGLSERSVEMVLKGAGFIEVVKEYVPSPHNQLVLHIKDQSGRYLMAGDRVPYTTKLTLEVASAEAYRAELLDSLGVQSPDSLNVQSATPEEEGESWF